MSNKLTHKEKELRHIAKKEDSSPIDYLCYRGPEPEGPEPENYRGREPEGQKPKSYRGKEPEGTQP